jgi:hypothetical protein
MSATGLDVFDKTLQTTNTWLSELMRDEAIGPDRQVALARARRRAAHRA